MSSDAPNIRRKWAIKPPTHLSDEAQDGNGKVNSIHWSLKPNVQDDFLPSLLGPQVTTLRMVDAASDEVPAVMVDAASSSVATAILQPRLGVHREVNI